MKKRLADCSRHGTTTHRLDGERWRCVTCMTGWINDSRRRKKALMVKEAGGECSRCGYDRCIAALEFHHRDPATKSFDLNRAWGKSLATLRLEVAKCDLLCANCHRETDDAGYRSTPKATAGFEPASRVLQTRA